MIASLIQQLSQACKAVEEEAMAALWALEFGLEVGVGNAIVEGDSELVVKALIKEDAGLAFHGLLIMDACNCTSSFSILSYSHTKREGNKVALNLAKLTIDFWNYTVSIKDVPPQIFLIFQADF